MKEPMHSKRLYFADNPDASKNVLRVHEGNNVKRQIELRGGICAAMCLLWFKRIFETSYASVQWDAVNDARWAKTIFLQFMMAGSKDPAKGWDDENAIYQNHGMTLHQGTEDTKKGFMGQMEIPQHVNEAVDWIKSTPELTCFKIGIPGHAMAGFWKKGECFFFDPNLGVYTLPSINVFALSVINCVRHNYLPVNDRPAGERELVFFWKVERGVQ